MPLLRNRSEAPELRNRPSFAIDRNENRALP